jgi:hypothetical protein
MEVEVQSNGGEHNQEDNSKRKKAAIERRLDGGHETHCHQKVDGDNSTTEDEAEEKKNAKQPDKEMKADPTEARKRKEENVPSKEEFGVESLDTKEREARALGGNRLTQSSRSRQIILRFLRSFRIDDFQRLDQIGVVVGLVVLRFWNRFLLQVRNGRGRRFDSRHA